MMEKMRFLVIWTCIFVLGESIWFCLSSCVSDLSSIRKIGGSFEIWCFISVGFCAGSLSSSPSRSFVLVSRIQCNEINSGQHREHVVGQGTVVWKITDGKIELALEKYTHRWNFFGDGARCSLLHTTTAKQQKSCTALIPVVLLSSAKLPKSSSQLLRTIMLTIWEISFGMSLSKASSFFSILLFLYSQCVFFPSTSCPCPPDLDSADLSHGVVWRLVKLAFDYKKSSLPSSTSGQHFMTCLISLQYSNVALMAEESCLWDWFMD